jgi:hypothetical protein
MHLYRAYGLKIASEIALPELVPAEVDTAAAVTIRRRRLDRPFSQRTPVEFEIGPRAAYLAWREVGAFMVEDGTTIIADLRPEIPDDLGRLPLLGAVLAILLHQRGFLVLHGSAVAIAGQGVIFLGHKGAGKSTMAAALFARGHSFIADDVVAVDCTSEGGPELMPGYPQMKLSEAAASVLLQEPGRALPRLHQWTDKRCRPVDDGSFTTRPVPPGRICTLARGNASRSTPAAPQETLTTLLQHSYVARFGAHVLEGAAGATHLRQCAALANLAPVHRLEVPGALEQLAGAARLLESDLSRAGSVVSRGAAPRHDQQWRRAVGG